MKSLNFANFTVHKEIDVEPINHFFYETLKFAFNYVDGAADGHIVRLVLGRQYLEATNMKIFLKSSETFLMKMKKSKYMIDDYRICFILCPLRHSFKKCPYIKVTR